MCLLNVMHLMGDYFLSITEILYEPLPVGRLGVQIDDQKVVIAQDYSCFASMLEEYIAHGAISIVIPKSSPEAKTIGDMPLLLRRRVRIVNDDPEEDSIERLFFGIRRELGITISEDTRQLKFPKTVPRELVTAVLNATANTKRLILAYNNQFQAEVNIENATKAYRFTRQHISDGNSKLILAQLEGLLKHYESAKYDSCAPKAGTGIELINAFDELVNDKDYIRYSDEIRNLGIPKTRDAALLRLRELSRQISTKKVIGLSWDYLSKVINVWTGIPIPESKELTAFTNEKPLPSLIDMQAARNNAVRNWLASPKSSQPLTREGLPVASEKIHWIPPMQSMKVHSPGDTNFSLGTVKELLDALNKFKDE